MSDAAAAAATAFHPGAECWYLQTTRKYRCRIGGRKIYYCRWLRVRVVDHTPRRVGVFVLKDGQAVGGARYVALTSLSHAEPPEGAEIVR